MIPIRRSLDGSCLKALIASNFSRPTSLRILDAVFRRYEGSEESTSCLQEIFDAHLFKLILLDEDLTLDKDLFEVYFNKLLDFF